MLKSKSILAPKDPDDGRIISVMSRHTLNDGKTPDTRIMEGSSYDEHIPKRGPSPNLVGKYYREEIGFDEYKHIYLQYLATIKDDLIDMIIIPALSTNMTLVCIEDSPEFCHRKILVKYCEGIARTLLGKDLKIYVD